MQRGIEVGDERATPNQIEALVECQCLEVGARHDSARAERRRAKAHTVAIEIASGESRIGEALDEEA